MRRFILKKKTVFCVVELETLYKTKSKKSILGLKKKGKTLTINGKSWTAQIIKKNRL